jgi:putative tricarboxylic transport membrane protein
VAAPEAANNATVGGALVPLIALGIPGSPATAIILGAFIIHGIQPGPNMFNASPELVNGLFYGFLIATIMMYIAGRLVTNLFARALTIPNTYLVPIVLTLSIVGIYTSQGLHFSLWLALVVGIAAFFLSKLDFSLPSFILAFILGPIIERSLRRSLLLSDGSPMIFIERPYALGMLLLILLFLVATFIGNRSKRPLGTAK